MLTLLLILAKIAFLVCAVLLFTLCLWHLDKNGD